MRLSDLLGPSAASIPASALAEIAGLASDSRKVQPGFLFAALPGTRTDGRQFIPDAIARGAAAILAPPGTRPPPAHPDLPLIVDENPRRRFAAMAARFFGVQPRTIVAVTGTNGKTSVVTFLRQVWRNLGHPAASLGTLGVEIAGKADSRSLANGLTTPDPVELHAALAALAREGIDHAAIEASSHGLAQHRLDGLVIAAAVFTNLTRDHLDYHRTMDAYLAAKTRLFTELLPAGGIAVVNADAAHAKAFARIANGRGHRLMTYGTAGADVRLESIEPLAAVQRLAVTIAGKRQAFTLPLVGAFQASNALCALAIALGLGADLDSIIAAIETLHGAPGRMALVARHPNGAPIFVDYAHTPDALQTVLDAALPHARGAIYVVFGCGGDRDPGKRPQMGQIAAERADHVIVTDDNPRTEDAAQIRAQILVGCPGAVEIADRAEAIAAAVRSLRAGDLLILAGKGHEQGQIVGTTCRPFNDADAARAAVTGFALQKVSS